MCIVFTHKCFFFNRIRCKEVTRGYGLPKKHFSEQSRCSYCCLEWDNKSEIKVWFSVYKMYNKQKILFFFSLSNMIFQLKPIKLSKRQRLRIKYNSKHKSTSNKESLLCSNEMVSIIFYIYIITIMNYLL